MDICEYCLVYTNTSKNIKQHIRRKHPEGDYVCPRCGSLYTTNKLFQEHMAECLPTGSPDTIGDRPLAPLDTKDQILLKISDVAKYTNWDSGHDTEDIDEFKKDLFKKSDIEDDPSTSDTSTMIFKKEDTEDIDEFKSLVLSRIDMFLKSTDGVLNLCVKKRTTIYFG